MLCIMVVYAVYCFAIISDFVSLYKYTYLENVLVK